MTDKNRMDTVEDVLELKAVEAQMLKTHEALEGFIEKSNAETEEAGKASVETKAAIDQLAEKSIDVADRLVELERSQADHFEGIDVEKTAGELLIESDEFKSFINRGVRGSAQIEYKTAIVNAVPSLTQPLTAGHRLDTVIKEPNRALRIRDLLPSGVTDSNIVWFPKEDTFTNAAAVVVSGSPSIVAENVTKPEAALTFTSDSEEVKTIAHWIPISKQALDDSNFLRSYADSRMMYGLALKVDTELLVGTGLAGTIEGIYTGRTAYAMNSPLDYATKLDVIRDAKGQLEITNYSGDFVVLNPADWADIELAKETAGMYIFSHPGGTIPQTIWGMNVVLSNSMAAGTFLVGATMGAQVWNRQTASLAISYEDSTNFVKNMATLLAEERLALTIYNAKAFVGGSFTVT